MVTSGGQKGVAHWRPMAALLWTVIIGGAALTFAVLQPGDAWRPAVADPASYSSHLVAQGPRLEGQTNASGPAPAVSATPLQLIIRRLGVDAAVEAVGVSGDGRMETPIQPDHVGWYRFGVRPGDTGDAVIDGHVDWSSGPAVFHDLESIAPGEEIVVISPAARITFKVDRKSTYSYRADVPGLFTDQGPAQLSLITCTGGWDPYRRVYLRRLVVHAVMTGKVANL